MHDWDRALEVARELRPLRPCQVPAHVRAEKTQPAADRGKVVLPEELQFWGSRGLSPVEVDPELLQAEQPVLRWPCLGGGDNLCLGHCQNDGYRQDEQHHDAVLVAQQHS